MGGWGAGAKHTQQMTNLLCICTAEEYMYSTAQSFHFKTFPATNHYSAAFPLTTTAVMSVQQLPALFLS